MQPVHAEVRPRKNESFEQLLKRFKQQVKKSGILQEFLAKRAYVKPSVQRRRKRLQKEKLLNKIKKKQQGKKENGR